MLIFQVLLVVDVHLPQEYISLNAHPVLTMLNAKKNWHLINEV